MMLQSAFLISWLVIIGLGSLRANNAQAATLYMPDNCANLQSCFGLLSSGGTLVIRNGIYTEVENQIRYNNKPMSGTATAYTMVKAENSGAVKFNGEGIRSMFDGTGTFTMSYVIFEGLQYIDGKTSLAGKAHNNRTAHHIKFLECGFANNLSLSYASYILVEDCYVVGRGRYNYLSFTSDNIIFRRCVARLDDADGRGMPIAHYVNYASRNVEFQNCLAIDSDDDYYSNYEGIYGGFYIRKPNTIGTTTYSSINTKIGGSMVLNVKHDRLGVSSPAEALSIGNGALGTEIIDSVWWDIARGMIIDNGPLNCNYVVNHSTFGKAFYNSSSSNVMLQGSNTYGEVNNSIFYQIMNPGPGNAYALNDISSSINNLFYGNDSDKYSVAVSSGDLTGIDPLTNGLKYLVRSETNSSLDNRGSDGSDLGATIIKKIGISGSLYGDIGYNEISGDNLWPWPNETLIRDFFRNYTASAGYHPLSSRGFAADGVDQFGKPLTLTRYIWQYLGNQIPCEIYNECNVNDLIAPSAPNGVVAY